MFELHHKKAGLIFSFFHLLTKARNNFHSRNYQECHSICDAFYNEFDNDKIHADLFRKTDGKAYNDKQLELIHLGISLTNASYLLITRHHINAVKGLLNQNINIHFINNEFMKIQFAEWYQLDLMSLGLNMTLSLSVSKFDTYGSIVKKFYEGVNIQQSYDEILEQSDRSALRIKK